MKTVLLTSGAFNLGVGIDRGWLPGVGSPFWLSLLIGAVALTVGLMLEARGHYR